MGSLGYGIPTPRTWYPGMPVNAPYLRADFAQAVALLGTPPVFIGQQAQNSQSVPNSTDTPVTIDTELYDNAYGHLDTTLPAEYFGMLPGWYLCEGTSAVAYNGGAGITTAGIGLVPSGGSLTTYYGQRIPNSTTSGQRAQPAVSKLIPIVTPGRPNGDAIQLVINQTSGSSQNTSIATSRFSWLQARWIAAPTGVAPLIVPLNIDWPVGTVLTGIAGGSSTFVEVADAAGLVPGGTIGLDIGTIAGETAVIHPSYTIGSLTVPLVSPTLFAHGPGSVVTVPVSAAFLNSQVRDTVNFLLYPPIMEAYYHAGSASLASQSSLPNTGTVIPMDRTAVDNYSAFNTGTGVWTAPVDGTYYCYAQGHQSMNSTSQALATGLAIDSANYNSGSAFTWWGGTQAAFTGAAAGNCAVTRRKLRLNAGDTVSAAAFQMDSGSATTTLSYAGGSAVYESRLIIVWQGA